MTWSYDFITSDVKAIGLQWLRWEILVNFATGTELLKYCGTVHWRREMLKIVFKEGSCLSWTVDEYSRTDIV